MTRLTTKIALALGAGSGALGAASSAAASDLIVEFSLPIAAVPFGPLTPVILAVLMAGVVVWWMRRRGAAQMAVYGVAALISLSGATLVGLDARAQVAGTILLGTTSPASITLTTGGTFVVTNTNAVAVTIDDFYVDAPPFVATNFGTCTTGQSLAAGDSCTIFVVQPL